MEKINLENIIKSFFLGLFIGVVLQINANTNIVFAYKAIAVLASGGIGFIIGFITEWLTAILPIRIANSKSYFFINNVIALMVTMLILVSLMSITRTEMTRRELIPMLLIVLGIICVANAVDYFMYRRAQRKLEAFKKLMNRK